MPACWTRFCRVTCFRESASATTTPCIAIGSQRDRSALAHLLRKAIKLKLSYPETPRYREFFEELLAVFREGQRLQKDGRLSAAGRRRKVEELEDRFRSLCSRFRPQAEQRQAPGGDDYAALLKELVRCLADGELLWHSHFDISGPSWFFRDVYRSTHRQIKMPPAYLRAASGSGGNEQRLGADVPQLRPSEKHESNQQDGSGSQTPQRDQQHPHITAAESARVDAGEYLARSDRMVSNGPLVVSSATARTARRRQAPARFSTPNADARVAIRSTPEKC